MAPAMSTQTDRQTAFHITIVIECNSGDCYRLTVLCLSASLSSTYSSLTLYNRPRKILTGKAAFLQYIHRVTKKLSPKLWQ